MTTYAWIGRTRTGQIVQGRRDARSTEELTRMLRREQILLTSAARATGRVRRPRSIAAKPLAVFTRQLSVMIDAGLPLVQCLELLADGEPDPRLSTAIRAVKTDVETGSSLADAMRKQPHVFDALYTNMVAAGEAGGILDTVLQRLAIFIEKRARLKSQIWSAMIYPVAVLTVAVVVVTLILWKVVPTFTSLFEGLNATLPWPTRAVSWVSQTLVVVLPFVSGGLVAGAWSARHYYRTAGGQALIDGLLLKVPLAGRIAKKVAVARFCRTLSTLLASGVPILDGLEITAKTSGNAVVETAIRHVRGRTERGETIAGPLRSTGLFPPMVPQMVGVGEQSGALDAMLARIAEFFEEEVDTAVSGLLTVLEPALICVLGVLVGGIVLSMYLPLFDLIDQLS